mgnify:FL=1
MLSLSVNYIREKKYINAEAYAKKVIKINPDLYDAYFLLGRSQQYQGLFLDAIKSYKTSISLNSNNSEPYYFLGMIYLKMKNDKNACKNFAMSASLDNIEAKEVMKRYCY